ncbi:MAG: anti-sigma F factor, partial [Lachnospiraceae bacterium]|nr:anti-sigma F factor [Lachnospiraceae bacterium]
VKTAVSEAVTNAIIHGYGNRGCITERVMMNCELKGDVLEVEVIDRGVGIEDVDRAMQPLFTTRPEWERSGMGFAFMEAFMDDLEVLSEPGQGTLVRMYKKIGLGSWIVSEE